MVTVALALSIISVSSTAAAASTDGKNWMANIPDNAYINTLNIPGSHDSGMYNAQWGAGYSSETQDLDIAEQLNAGVRIFDIRLRYGGGGRCYLCHGAGINCCDAYDGSWGALSGELTYNKVLSQFAEFLKDHPSETIIATVQHEYKADDEPDDYDKGNNLWNFQLAMENDEYELLKRLARQGKKIIRLTNDLRMLPITKQQDGKILAVGEPITMGEARGNVLLFQYGIGFGDLMDSQYNDFDLTFADKWRVIEPFFDSAPDQNFFEPKTKGTFRAAFTSCTGQYTYNEKGEKILNNLGVGDLVIPSPGSEASYINPLLLDYQYDYGAYYGWISMDFVTSDLAAKIYNANDINNTGRVTGKTTYIKALRGFCDDDYDDAIEECFSQGYKLLIGDKYINVNPDGDPIVIGYKETQNPDEAITDIKGSYNDEGPKGYNKVLVDGSLYNYFTRWAGSKSEDTYLFVSYAKGKSPIVALELLDDKSGNDMVKLKNSEETFNLQEGLYVRDNVKRFYGINMVREDSDNPASLNTAEVTKTATAVSSGNAFIVIAGIIILAASVIVLFVIRRKKAKLV